MFGRNVQVQNIRVVTSRSKKSGGETSWSETSCSGMSGIETSRSKMSGAETARFKKSGAKRPGCETSRSKVRWRNVLGTKRPGPKSPGRNVLVRNVKGRNVQVRNVSYDSPTPPVDLYDYGTSWGFFIIVAEKYHSEILYTLLQGNLILLTSTFGLIVQYCVFFQ